MKKILIVDDESYTRFFFKNILEKHGKYVFFEAGSGREALLTLHDKKIDLMLLDMTMPGMTGLDLLSEIRKKERFEDLPVVVITSQNPDKFYKKCEKFEVKQFFTKLDVLDSGKGNGQEKFLATVDQILT